MTVGPDFVERGETALGEAVIKLDYAVVDTMSEPTAGDDPIDAR
ncbi:hypothetical protein [Actinopolyspora erythraea]|nr:hypothetical protein [Actinopolyspora erythraea]